MSVCIGSDGEKRGSFHNNMAVFAHAAVYNLTIMFSNELNNQGVINRGNLYCRSSCQRYVIANLEKISYIIVKTRFTYSRNLLVETEIAVGDYA